MPDFFQTKDPPLKLINSWRHYPSTASTNADALNWINAGASDQSLITADHQTQGRGREDRTWVTNPNAGLAFSLICKLSLKEEANINRFTALAALALVRHLRKAYHLAARIKWPNDVLINGKKVAGILVESLWEDEHVSGLVIGMGINVTVDALPKDMPLRYPAGCIEADLGCSVDREQLLWGILEELCQLRQSITSPKMIRDWNRCLAYKRQTITLRYLDGRQEPVTVIGVSNSGCLIAKNGLGQRLEINAGEFEISYNRSTELTQEVQNGR